MVSASSTPPLCKLGVAIVVCYDYQLALSGTGMESWSSVCTHYDNCN